MEQACIRKRLRFKDGNGHEVITRDLFQKIACSTAQFKAGGHIELQFDPINASFPWAAIQFLLRTPITDAQEYGVLTNDLVSATDVVTRNDQIWQQKCKYPKQTGLLIADHRNKLSAL
jgi:hypothetical protein